MRRGRGVGPAGLDFGDRFTCAVAQELDRPLLYVGNDFARTDIASALRRDSRCNRPMRRGTWPLAPEGGIGTRSETRFETVLPADPARFPLRPSALNGP